MIAVRLAVLASALAAHPASVDPGATIVTRPGVDEPANLIDEVPLSPDREFLKEVTRELLAMNMSSATLFPGLDGFARNLTALLEGYKNGSVSEELRARHQVIAEELAQVDLNLLLHLEAQT